MTGAPRPLLTDGSVTIDPSTRALVVRPTASASATARHLWREAVRAQAERPGSAHTIWAKTVAGRSVAFGLPEGNALAFHVNDGSVWRELVSSPGLTARIALDAANPRNIIGVTFRAR